MNNREIARNNADKRAKKFMIDHDTVLTAIPIYSAEKTGFDTAMTKLETAIQNQAEETKVIAADKAGLKDVMSSAIYKLALRASVQASQLGNIELELALDKSLTYLSRVEDELSATRATELKQLMKDNILILTEIKATDITAMEDAIKAFTDIQYSPGDEIKHKKATGTDPIPVLLNEIDLHKNNIGKIVHSYLPDLAHEWDVETKVGTPAGTRHTSVALHFTDVVTGVHLKNVKCTITDGIDTIIKMSTAKGWVRAFSLDSGNWTFTSELSTYTTDVQTNIGIEEDNIVKLEIKLQKKTLNDNGTPPIDPETTTGILDLYVYDKATGEPLPDVQVSIQQLNYVDTTDEDAEVYKDLIAPGQYAGKLFLDGYKPLDFTFTIEAGKTNSLQLYLENA